jgi:hypothetical protein
MTMMNATLRERFIGYLCDLKDFYSGVIIRMEYDTKLPNRDATVDSLRLKIRRINDDLDLLRASLEDG